MIAQTDPRDPPCSVRLSPPAPAAAASGASVIADPVALEQIVHNLVMNGLQALDKVPEAERELVFQPFYRALGTEVDGSGLGLAIVREIAERHEASVSIESTHPHSSMPGTRVTVRFVVHAAQRIAP